MSATIEKREVTEQGTEEEAPFTPDDHQRQLEDSTSRLPLINPLPVVFALVARCVVVVALFFALSSRSDNASKFRDRAPTAPATNGAQPAAMASGGGMAMATSGAATGKISVDLGDFWVKPSAATVRAGKVTFVAHNVGTVEHELMIERMPLKMDGPGAPNEDAAQGMIDDMQPGKSGRMTVKLTPRKYVLFCRRATTPPGSTCPSA